MYKKIFNKVVGLRLVLASTLIAIFTSLLAPLTLSQTAFAATACDPALDPSCGGQTTNGTCSGTNLNGILNACDANWADGTTIFVSSTVKRNDTSKLIQPTFDFTPATFTYSSISGNNMILSNPGPSSDEAGHWSVKGCKVLLEVDNYKTQTIGNGITPTALLKIPKLGHGGDASVYGCQSYENPITITLGNTWTLATGGGTTNLGGTSASNNPDQQNCPIQSGDSLRWLLCPVVILGQVATAHLTDLIKDYLYTPTDQIFTDNFHKAFNTFRNLGIALLFIAGLVMVVSQAAGLEIFAAYTVRKALPRIIIAAIAMGISWQLLEFAVTFFNDLGYWSAQLINAAVNVPGAGSQSDFGDQVKEAFLGGGTLGVALITMGWGILPLLGTIFLALLVGVFVLALRQLVILVCILIAPLAIAASILPSTERLWHFWRDTLIGALLMFPIIMSFIYAGQAMAYIAGSVGSTPMSILAVIVYFAPFFILPLAFRMASGLMGNIFGMVNDRSRGAFDRLRNARQTTTARNMEKLWSGRRFRGNNALTAGINTVGGRAGAFGAAEDKLGFVLNPDARAAAVRRHRETARAKYGKEEATMAGQFDEDMLIAQSYDNAGQFRQNILAERGEKWALRDASGNVVRDASGNMMLDNARVNRAIASAQMNGGFNRTSQDFAVRQLAAIGTGYDTLQQMSKAMARGAHGNAQMLESYAGEMRSSSERSGRGADLKAAFGTNVELAKQEMDALQGNGTGPSRYAYAAAGIEAARNADNATIARGRAISVGNAAEALSIGIQNPEAVAAGMRSLNSSVNVDEFAQALPGQIVAKIENIKGSQNWGPETNAAKLADVLADRSGRIGPPGAAPTLVNETRQQISNVINPPTPPAPPPPEPSPILIPGRGPTTADITRTAQPAPARPTPAPTPPPPPSPAAQAAANAYRTEVNRPQIIDPNDPRANPPGGDEPPE